MCITLAGLAPAGRRYSVAVNALGTPGVQSSLQLVAASWLVQFYVLETSPVISGWELICDSVQSWQLSSAAPLGDQANSTMTWHPTQSNYPDTEATSPYPLLIMPSACLETKLYQFLSHWFDLIKVRLCEVRILRSPKTEDGRSTHSAILPGVVVCNTSIPCHV